MHDSYPRFLKAKHQIDAQSINQRILQRFLEILRQRGCDHGRLRIVEIGAGLGATACRMIDALRGIPLEYVLLDIASMHLEQARIQVDSHLREAGYELAPITGSDVHGSRDGVLLRVSFLQADATSVEVRAGLGDFDVLIGQALLDLVDLDKDLDVFLSFLKPGGVFYFPITYDGLTHFGPSIDVELDERIASYYSISMDMRAKVEGRRGGSRAGRMALDRLRRLPLAMLDAGSSDWVVFAGPGGYAAGVIGFLQEILQYVEKEIRAGEIVEARTAAEWLRCRRNQIDSGELIFVAHQLDLLGQLPE